MKLSDFSKPALTGEAPAPPVSSPGVSPSSPEPIASSAPQEEQIPGQLSVYDALDTGGSAATEEVQYFTSVTPSGIEVAYSPAPRRHYKLRQTNPSHKDFSFDATEVPSVTTVLGVLDRSGPLTWWGMKVGAEGVIEMFKRGELGLREDKQVVEWHGRPVDGDVAAELLTHHKLTVNHVKDSAADRGVNVHGDLEAWVKNGTMPSIKDRLEAEWGYIQGLAEFLLDVEVSSGGGRECELMVGSLEHSYAGRFDLVLTLSKPVDVVTRAYPKRPPKVEEIPAGRYLLDLKTRKKANVYDSNYLQLEAYEAAAVECGYEPTDYRGVIVVTEDGKYQLSINRDWTFQDFLAVRNCYAVMNERGVVQALRDELDAKEVK